MSIKTKTCSHCGLSLPLANFVLNSKCPHRHTNVCKSCNWLMRKNQTRFLNIGHLRFPQHADSVRDQHKAESNGLPIPLTMYAYYGGIKLDEPSIKARINYLQSIGMVHANIKMQPLTLRVAA